MSVTSNPVKVSHKRYRALLKKLRRKKIRQVAARSRSFDDKEELVVHIVGPVDERLKWFEDEQEKTIQHGLWLERERKAQEEFDRVQEIERQQAEARALRERQIREEWDKQQKKLKYEDEQKKKAEQLKNEREETLMRDLAAQPRQDDGPTHNPFGPLPESTHNFGTEMDRQNCPFFLKTAACRFGDRCSRHHEKPSSSCTLLIPNMYSHFSIQESFRDEYDTDIGLEYEDSETYQHFREFYQDVVPEFKKIGKLVQFKTCCNHEPHLRGNVYVQYTREEDAVEAFRKFNGRWYAGKQLSCQFTNVTKWKSAICGLFARKRCPKGRSCNFLHVFRNPSNEFHLADLDYQPTPRDQRQHSSDRRSSRRSSWSESYRDRSSSRRARSRSRERERSRYSHRHEEGRSSRRSNSHSTRRSDREEKISNRESKRRRSIKKKVKKHKKKKSSYHDDSGSSSVSWTSGSLTDDDSNK